ncbi:ABC transporter ATP-binding protein [Pseudactinotalea sp. Z1732]|uniref:ABC transporter ATP-binding protein n=1 Tax=Pseudactinotalea sp. Z1732 TaxID=3413026 RepID=UPI003C7E9E6D
MSAVEVVQVHKAFGQVRALDGVDLSLGAGKLLAVLGPSGCGKTTLLRVLAGFEEIDAGRIALEGRAVSLPGVHLPPHRRHAAIVPQDGGLFPHLSVADNIAFGLGRRKLGRRGTRDRVAECLDLVGLSGLGSRMPHELSGGQQQRVAVARALAPRPPLVLLDEPFSALDATLRTEVRQVVRQALAEDGATALMVTHDQAEALSMADEIAVMRAGRILQAGRPAEIYRAPVDPWVAGFVGEAQLLPVLERDGQRVRTVLGWLGVTGTPGPGQTQVMLRPEQVTIHPTEGPGAPATVVSVDYYGHDALVILRAGDHTTVLSRVVDGPQAALQPGTPVTVAVLGKARCYAGNSETGAEPVVGDPTGHDAPGAGDAGTSGSAQPQYH